MLIPFHKPSIGELEERYTIEALMGGLSGDGTFTRKARELFFEKTGVNDLLLTTSCTHALEMAAMLCDIQPGDEVILPSYTFSSTANAFLLRGAKLVFCEIAFPSMNMDVEHVKALITTKTKVIVPVHYAGVLCEMCEINNLAKEHNLMVVEDAAQAVGSTYKNSAAGTLSDFGCYSFHATKNYCMGEGGGIVVRSRSMLEKAEMIREKGTDRSLFLRGQVDKYTWRQAGSSYLPSDVLAAVLCGQLKRFEEIMDKRMRVWNAYHSAFIALDQQKLLTCPKIPEHIQHNAHMYFLILPDAQKRDALMYYLNQQGIQAVTHYEPLHASPMGAKMGYRAEDLPVTQNLASRLLRLPLWADMDEKVIEKVAVAVAAGLHQ